MYVSKKFVNVLKYVYKLEKASNFNINSPQKA